MHLDTINYPDSEGFIGAPLMPPPIGTAQKLAWSQLCLWGVGVREKNQNIA